ncbi:hypothetical protein [Acidisoma sp. S159]|uniref:hypothetical protein n=1 Tax=Acidisoma sp. S159 TaxID=1747225 RepID=UPI00131AB199|nr:hypothetical protein [Acidisoma sp. S159]
MRIGELTGGWARKDSPPDDIPADRIAATEAVRVRDEALMRRLVRNQTRHMEALQKDLQQVAMQPPNLHTERQAREVAAIRQRFAEPIRKMEKRHKSWLGRVERVAFGKGRQAHAMERLTGKRDQAIGRKLHLQAESEARRQMSLDQRQAKVRRM